MPTLRNAGCMLLQDKIFSTRALYNSPWDEVHCAVRCQQLVIWSRDVIRLFSSRREKSRQGEYDDPVHLSAATSSVTCCQIEVPCSKSVHPPSSWITYNLNFVTHVAFWNYVTVTNMNWNITHKNCAALYNRGTYSCGRILRAGIMPNYVVWWPRHSAYLWKYAKICP
jgi:hypothetical protein